MLTAIVGHSEKLANDARELGKLAHELESEAANQPAWWTSLRSGAPPEQRIAATAGTVAEDYRQLGAEILQLLAAAEQQS